jgi:hypothetical protein
VTPQALSSRPKISSSPGLERSFMTCGAETTYDALHALAKQTTKAVAGGRRYGAHQSEGCMSDLAPSSPE